jgi:hypothetical protein
MKRSYKFLFLSTIIAGVFFVACRKSINDTPPVATAIVDINSVPQIKNFQCNNSPDYGDSIIYLQPTKNDYVVKPVNQTSLGKGKYIAWPTGLAIDSASGVINVSQSETGMRYLVGFVRSGSTDTCLRNIILAGITYVDSVYVLSNNDTLAPAVFNANVNVAPVCNSGNQPGDDNKPDGDDKCQFDKKGKDGKKGHAKDKNVAVNTINGAINLKATLNSKAFGNNPANGTSVIVPIYYSLSDNSKQSLQLINVDLRFYNKRSEIPVSLLNEIQNSRTSFYQNTPILSLAPRPPVIVVTNFY